MRHWSACGTFFSLIVLFVFSNQCTFRAGPLPPQKKQKVSPPRAAPAGRAHGMNARAVAQPSTQPTESAVDRNAAAKRAATRKVGAIGASHSSNAAVKLEMALQKALWQMKGPASAGGVHATLPINGNGIGAVGRGSESEWVVRSRGRCLSVCLCVMSVVLLAVTGCVGRLAAKVRSRRHFEHNTASSAAAERAVRQRASLVPSRATLIVVPRCAPMHRTPLIQSALQHFILKL